MAAEDVYGFPVEFYIRPVPLIGLSGLDITRNSTHRFIWEAFNKNQSHLPLALKMIPPGQQFPVVKPAKGSYERYIPKGILKRNWIKKHLEEIPAVVAVLAQLNWDDPNYEQLHHDTIQHFISIKNRLGQLGSKLVVILIQKVAPLPAGEDTRGGDRAAALCQACNLPSKQLYVIPHDDHLQGYVTRLLTALLDLAKVYYSNEIRHIKSHKEQLNKMTHRYLFVRHNFKIAFLCELKQEDRSARSFYETAYTYMKEVRPSDTNLHELKTVAGLINYKLCSVMFRLGEPRDALSQLRAHVRLYKTWLGPKALLFEHYAWLSVQYAAFADLFDNAIKLGLSAMQTEHPGIYYRQAALYSIERKKAAREVCQPEAEGVTREGGAAGGVGGGGEFLGQRSWRPGQLSVEPLDSAAERDGIRALQGREDKVDHSGIIIGYLGQGMTQFKTHRCPRMRLQMIVQMAEEYHQARDHGKALTLLTHILSDYREEQWWGLLAALLQLSLSSAFLSANIQDYLAFAVEALSPVIPLADDAKHQLFQNFIAVLQGQTPGAPGGGTAADVSNAASLWSSAVSPSPIVVDMTNVRVCFTARAGFTQSELQAGQPLGLRILIKSHCPGAVEICAVKAQLTWDNSPQSAQEVGASPMDVSLDGGGLGVFTCSVTWPQLASRRVSVTGVSLTLVSRHPSYSPRPFTLKLRASPLPDILPNEFSKLRHIDSSEEWTRGCGSSTACMLAPRAAVELGITHEAPALLGEQYPITLTVTHSDTMPLYNPVLELKINTPNDESSPDASTRLSDEKQTSISPRSIKVMLETLHPGSITNTRVFLKGYSQGQRALTATLTYSPIDDVTTPSNMSSAIEEQTVVPVIQPFRISHETLTSKLEPASHCYAHEPFFLCTNVHITSACPLVIRHSTLEPSVNVSPECSKPQSQLAGVTLYPGDMGRDMFPVIIAASGSQPVAVGTYVLQWSREGDATINSSSITLPALMCQESVLSVAMSLPAHGRVRTPMAVEYKLYNRTPMLLQLEMHMDASEAFMFAGQRQAVLQLLPECERRLEYNLYPLLSGLLALPRLILTAPDLNDQLASSLERSLPSHVYVMPQEKNGTSVSL